MPGAPSPQQRRGIPYAPTNTYQPSHPQAPHGHSSYSSRHDHTATHLSGMMSGTAPSHLPTDPSISMLRNPIQPTSPIPSALGINSLLGQSSLMRNLQGTNISNTTNNEHSLPLSNPSIYHTPPQLPDGGYSDILDLEISNLRLSNFDHIGPGPTTRDRYMSHPNYTSSRLRDNQRERTRRNTVHSESDHILSCFIGTSRHQSY